jgi:hypothetical protein
MKEFIEGVHFSKKDKFDPNKRYWEYLRNQYQSKAFLFGFLSGTSAVLLFLRFKKSDPYYNKLSKIFYSINLFLAAHVFVYEMWSNMYSDKEKVYELDKKILKLE